MVFASPAILAELRSIILKILHSTLGDTIFAVAYLVLVGLGFSVLASLISQERRKIFWLLFVGPFGLFFTSWASNVLLFRLYHEYHVTFLGGVASVALRNVLIGMIVGLLLGLVLEFKKQDDSPGHFLPPQMDSL